jgi:hypothetical protein
MKRPLLFIIIVAILTPTARLTDYFTGNDLAQLATSDWPPDVGMFRGYVAGVQDYNNGRLLCVHEGVRLNQAGEIVLKYLKDNPEKWHKAAKFLVIDALRLAFPCKGQGD